MLHNLVAIVIQRRTNGYPALVDNFELKTILSPDACHVMIAPSKVQQVLLNLLVNAKQSMHEGGTIVLKTFLPPTLKFTDKEPTVQYAGICVEDSGSGMDEDTLSKTFDPFFTSKRNGEGTGLGLTTVKDIVEAHGGFLEVTSSIGAGSHFSVYLPTASCPE